MRTTKTVIEDDDGIAIQHTLEVTLDPNALCEEIALVIINAEGRSQVVHFIARRNGDSAVISQGDESLIAYDHIRQEWDAVTTDWISRLDNLASINKGVEDALIGASIMGQGWVSSVMGFTEECTHRALSDLDLHYNGVRGEEE